MATTPGALLEALLDRIDWLADRGAAAMRVAAAGAWLGAGAATVTTFSLLGAPGWLLGLVCLLPGWILWRYGKRLTSALDVAAIKDQLDDAADLAKTRLAQVVAGVQTTRRQILRGALDVVKTVRALRADLTDFGVDVTGITLLANPGRLGLVVAGLVAALGLWLIAAIAIVLRIML